MRTVARRISIFASYCGGHVECESRETRESRVDADRGECTARYVNYADKASDGEEIERKANMSSTASAKIDPQVSSITTPQGLIESCPELSPPMHANTAFLPINKPRSLHTCCAPALGAEIMYILRANHTHARFVPETVYSNESERPEGGMPDVRIKLTSRLHDWEQWLDEGTIVNHSCGGNTPWRARAMSSGKNDVLCTFAERA